jgi:hypothetical protein
MKRTSGGRLAELEVRALRSGSRRRNPARAKKEARRRYTVGRERRINIHSERTESRAEGISRAHRGGLEPLERR